VALGALCSDYEQKVSQGERKVTGTRGVDIKESRGKREVGSVFLGGALSPNVRRSVARGKVRAGVNTWSDQS